MPTAQQHNSDIEDRSNSLDASGGFSLMHALKGGASVVSSSTHSDADSSTALLREGLTSPAKTATTTKSSSHHAHRSPQPAAMPHHSAAVPMRATKSFTSSSNYYNQQQKLQQQRRSVNYRNAPKKFSPKKRTETLGSGNASGGPGGRHAYPAGLSPANSMDSEDQRGGGGGTGSIHTATGHGSKDQGHSLKTTSFDDCYSSATPGYHDAFTLLEGVERGSSASGSANSNTDANVNANANVNAATPSPRSGGHVSLRSFFPASPKRINVPGSPRSSPKSYASRVAPSSPIHRAPFSPERDMSTIPSSNSSGSSGGSKKKPPQAAVDGWKENNYSTPPAFSLDDNSPSSAATETTGPPNTPQRNGAPSLSPYAVAPSPSFNMPAPPSGQKKP
eukprot:CAMPEP_0172535074 /NCGR_PEP_ID=MMETSP1067-20121228/7234_1 /TAXON_ID=265564 ORGANISM="Thalassiosira punctigera, Strain Tpunct2005C2" /NCGR_SAMPLE_ID=MMETSP1067 /ASSEMBLY_ACC=CAM_ASM_000444 /LENGTH=390 /DNA_ID=CAMNT_0013319969 /DNA_START=130 /DNA_END=1298 /DNA_ORIENTATION=+